MSTRNNSWGQRRPVRRADNLTTLCVTVLKSGSLNHLETYGHVQACHGIAVPFPLLFYYTKLSVLFISYQDVLCVKSILLYGCKTWLVTSEIRRKMQTFVNRCLWYILRIWWPNIISNKDLWRVTGQEDINLEIRIRKFRWTGHTLRKEDGEIPKAALLWNPQGSRKRGRPKTSWGRSVIKEGGAEAGMNWGSRQLIEVERAHRQPMFLKEQWTHYYYYYIKTCLATVGK
jgi:hypothetical protein